MYFCIYYLFWRDTSIQGKGALFLGANQNTLELEKWQTAERVDIFKSTQITIMEAFTDWTGGVKGHSNKGRIL